jgi:hypothetical protein
MCGRGIKLVTPRAERARARICRAVGGGSCGVFGGSPTGALCGPLRSGSLRSGSFCGGSFLRGSRKGGSFRSGTRGFGSFASCSLRKSIISSASDIRRRTGFNPLNSRDGAHRLVPERARWNRQPSDQGARARRCRPSTNSFTPRAMASAVSTWYLRPRSRFSSTGFEMNPVSTRIAGMCAPSRT